MGWGRPNVSRDLYLFLLPLYYIKYSELYSKGLNYVTFN